MTTTTDAFSLTPDRERAFWQAAQTLGVDPQASALTLVRAVLTLRDRAAFSALMAPICAARRASWMVSTACRSVSMSAIAC